MDRQIKDVKQSLDKKMDHLLKDDKKMDAKCGKDHKAMMKAKKAKSKAKGK